MSDMSPIVLQQARVNWLRTAPITDIVGSAINPDLPIGTLLVDIAYDLYIHLEEPQRAREVLVEMVTHLGPRKTMGVAVGRAGKFLGAYPDEVVHPTVEARFTSFVYEIAYPGSIER